MQNRAATAYEINVMQSASKIVIAGGKRIKLQMLQYKDTSIES